MLGYVNFPVWLRPEVIPGIPIRWYGLMYLLAFFITFQLFFFIAVKEKRLNTDKDTILNLFFWGVLAVLIGGRVFSVLIYDPTRYYLDNPVQIIFPFQRIGERLKFTGLQGMSYHGGLLGALLATVIYSRLKGLNALRVVDLMAVSAPLGYTFGRLGNFINGELYGRITTSKIGMIFPNAPSYSINEDWVQSVVRQAGMQVEESKQFVNLPRFPSQLFEAFFEGVFLWLVLWLLLRKWRGFPGYLTGLYFIGYGIIRFIIEYYREPDAGIGFPLAFRSLNNPAEFSVFNFTTGQVLSFIMVGIGLVWFTGFYFLDQRIHTKSKELVNSTNKLRKVRRKLR